MTGDDGPGQSIEAHSTWVENPDDYNRLRRIGGIHDAREAVHSYIRENDLSFEPGRSFDRRKGEQFARLVSMYIIELVPLMEEVDAEEELLPDGTGTPELRQFAGNAGTVPLDSGYGVPTPQDSISMFSAANRFFRRAGLDLEIHDGPGYAEFDYSDILDNGPPEYHGDSNEVIGANDRQPGEIE